MIVPSMNPTGIGSGGSVSVVDEEEELAAAGAEGMMAAEARRASSEVRRLATPGRCWGDVGAR